MAVEFNLHRPTVISALPVETKLNGWQIVKIVVRFQFGKCVNYAKEFVSS
jgi:hypothetical protein